MRIPFAEWRPDVADLDSEFATVAKNVIPAARSYRPLQGFAAFSNALGSTCLGATACRQAVGTVMNFAATGTKLYKLSAGTWSDVSRTAGGAYTAGVDDYWQFKQFGSLAIATNYRDVIQSFNVDTPDANWAALAGTPPKAQYIGIVGDHVVLGKITTNTKGLAWSGTNNAAFWTPGTQDCDVQTFPDGGDVMGIASGTVGYVFQQSSIRRMLPKPGSSTIYQFDVIEPDRGLLAARSLVQVGRRIFYLANDGFFVFTGEGSQAIGAERVDRTFFSRVDRARLHKVIGAADPTNQLIIWIYTSTESPDTNPDKALIYHWTLDRWTEATIAGELIVPMVTESITLDSMPSYGYTNLDTLPFSLDASFWLGGNVLLGLFGTDHKLQVSTGINLAATFETGQVGLNQGGRTYVAGVRPLIDASDATIAVATGERMADSKAFSAAVPMETTGDCGLASSGRYHRFRASTPAGSVWTQAVGIDLDPQADGTR